VDFLQGVFEKTTSFGLKLSYEIVRNGFVRVNYRHDRGESDWSFLDGEAYPGNRSEFYFSLSFNY